MVDKAGSMGRSKVGGVIGQLDKATMMEVERSLAGFLGIAK